MSIIKLLPENVANQIAAGEVVHRPSSVVKELLENSIDSGANLITLIIKDAGKTLIRRNYDNILFVSHMTVQETSWMTETGGDLDKIIHLIPLIMEHWGSRGSLIFSSTWSLEVAIFIID